MAGLFLGVWLLGLWYWVTNQYIVQRVLGAKSLKHPQWGALLGGALKLLPDVIMTVISAVAFVTLSLIDDRDEPDSQTIWTLDKALDTEAGYDGAIWQDIRLHALLLIMAMGGVLWLFW